jgi:hypothetical protein
MLVKKEYKCSYDTECQSRIELFADTDELHNAVPASGGHGVEGTVNCIIELVI